MSSRLTSILPNYSSYQADQVLTHTQLNETIAYFEDQDRLTRIGLSGVGIAYGLTLERQSSAGVTTITVHQGYGITTDGDLITLYRPLEEGSKEKTIQISSLSFTHYRPFEDEHAQYDRLIQGEEQGEMYELCEEGAEEAHPLHGWEDFDDHVLLLYLESYPRSPDTCGDINCDNQGVEQVAKLRFLLIPLALAEHLVEGDSIFQQFNERSEIVRALRPISLMKVQVNGDTVKQAIDLDRQYRIAIEESNALEDFQSGLRSILDFYNTLWHNDPVVRQLSNDLQGLLDRGFDFDNSQYGYNQYRYKLLLDVLDTYLSLLQLVRKLHALPNPDITAFPKHLLLGRPGHEDYRHGFYPSPVISDYYREVEEIRFLLRKIYYQLFSFDPVPDLGVRIIPIAGKDNVPSIPFYYHNSSGLRQHWTSQSLIIPFTYFFDLGQNPLLFEVESDGYLIGGHLGQEGENTFQLIRDRVREFGLEFSIHHIDLALQPREYQQFIREHPGITHRAGVRRGGTYVLISENNRVIADFSLNYTLSPIVHQGSSHIKVEECRYPWISSLKYLNNLSRSLRGTPRRVGVAPTHYRLVVNEYAINGQALITGPVVVNVPLEEILTRRMHAITEALNRRFPEGLIFDFNEHLKRFVIIRAFDDQFRVTFSDNTLSVSSPAFTYTQEGYFRGNQPFRLESQRCEERRRYRPTTYRQLQDEFAPVNKDDDQGRYQGRWAEWYSLIERLDRTRNELVTPRFIRRLNDLPNSVRLIIERVRGTLNQSSIPHELYLSGEWVEGGWVSIEMLNRYGSSNNIHEPAVRFVQLRRILHHKDQATKASLFVVLNRESDRTRLMNILEPWTNRADIYIEGPRVRGRRLIIDGKEKIRIT